MSKREAVLTRTFVAALSKSVGRQQVLSDAVRALVVVVFSLWMSS